MDKYEFNIKVEQIKKLVNKGDYETAMKIADTIDWRRVRSANLLALIAEIYENNEEYQEAKEVLLLAFERAPIGKRLLYKLADLALKENNLREAEDYYREFCDLAPEDPRQHLLRYQILKAKHAPDEQLIHSLERYTNTELDEKWLYELAELYCRAGKEEECIQTCDKIMLMFGLGKFVDKAMQLKVQYAPLSSYQKDLVENRDKYEEKLRAVEQQFGDETREIMGEDYENGGRVPETFAEGQSPREERYNSAEAGQESYPEQETPLRTYSKPHPEVERMPETEPVVIIDEPAMAAEPAGEMEIQTEGRDNAYQTTEEELRARIHQEETEKMLAREMSRISIEEYREPASPMEQTKVIGSIREVLSAYSPGKEHMGQQSNGVWSSGQTDKRDRVHMIMPEEKPVGREEVMRRAAEVNYLMIETRTPEKGLELAVEVLKRLHKQKGTKCPVVKITGSKLSRKGVMESSDKLADKDLIIEEAGDLTVVALIELEDLIENSEIRVIMIDNPRQIESMARVNPALGSLFTVISLKEDGDLEIRRPEPVVRLEEEKTGMAEMPAQVQEQEVSVRTVHEMAPQYAAETPVVEEAVKLEETPDETARPTVEEPAVATTETTVSVEEPAVESEETKAAAMAEFMKLMESVIDVEPVVKKPDAEDPGDNTAAVMAEFMRLMEHVAEDPSVMAEAERMEAEKLASENITEETPIEEKLAEEPQTEETVAEEPETPFAGEETEVPVTPVTPLMQTIQPESPMAAAMAAATAVPAGMAGVPVMPVMVESPVTATMTSSSAVPVGVTGIPVTPIIMQSIPQPVNNTASLRSDEEMELHDFVEYTCKYASDIDCSITGKSMLALYERIEVMEENGVPLTKINAENLIEEAADKAEKFSFKKLFTGLFHPRYDKEGLLILREEHFMD